MIRRIKAGEANGILCWELSRLARNPDEAGLIMGMLQRGEIKHIKTYGKDYYSDDNSVISFVEFGIANQFSRDLSKNVKRGMNKKADIGWRPGKAPIGYLNSKTKLKGEQDMSSDPHRFPLVKQLFQTMLTGNYTVPQLLEYATKELSLRLPATKHRPSREIGMSTMYRILTNPFYYGWYEWPHGSGNWIQGKHQPMITEDEFDRIQFLLGRDGRPRPKTHKFAFTGLMKCACGAGITCEEKFKHQKNGNTHHYIYYRCTKKKDPNCTEKSVELTELTKQIDAVLEKVTISERFKTWGIAHLHKMRTLEAQAQEQTIAAKHKEHERLINQLDSLLLKYTSPENTKGELMSQDEYSSLRSRLLKDKTSIETEMTQQNQGVVKWLEMAEQTFHFARNARAWFAEGDLNTKRAIFACIGSHLVLKDRKVAVELRKPFNFIVEGLPLAESELERLEPLSHQATASQLASFEQQFPVLSG